MRIRAGQQARKDRLVFRAAPVLVQSIDLYSKLTLAIVFACAISVLNLDAVVVAREHQCSPAALGSQGLRSAYLIESTSL